MLFTHGFYCIEASTKQKKKEPVVYDNRKKCLYGQQKKTSFRVCSAATSWCDLTARKR